MEQALVEVGRWLRQERYQFVTVTPETHKRVNARATPVAQTLRDVFGWNRPFAKELLPVGIVSSLAAAGALLETPQGLRSGVRFSSLGPYLFAHSSYPTHDVDAVFLGPDTYRFCRALERADTGRGRLVDVGCGTGAGGIVAVKPGQALVLSDISTKALAFARVNAALAEVENVEFVQSDGLAQIKGPIDCVICNPPYLRDERRRTYRDGGGSFGEALALKIVGQSLERLPLGGRLCLYTGATMVNGEDTLWRGLQPLLARPGVVSSYEELDPDVFGEELSRPIYAGAERIAVVWLTATVG
ncbi:MAG: class I SAM-dependent methyltransferase [Deltaproteobacteria bacterium]|nr:class I SAM-dependent methyltransferase [Deltaproteobacteria bacterium]